MADEKQPTSSGPKSGRGAVPPGKPPGLKTGRGVRGDDKSTPPPTEPKTGRGAKPTGR